MWGGGEGGEISRSQKSREFVVPVKGRESRGGWVVWKLVSA